MLQIIISSCIAFFLGMLFFEYITKKERETQKRNFNKILWYFNLLNLWIYIKQHYDQKKLQEYMNKKNYHQVAIYGMTELGKRLYDELQKLENINIKVVIDKNKYIFGDFKLISPNDKIPDVDVIIVTAEYSYYEIKPKLEKKVNCPIITLGGLLGDAYGINI